MKIKGNRCLSLILIAILLSACATQASNLTAQYSLAATQSETQTPRPTTTLTPLPTIIPSPSPTSEPANTPIPTPPAHCRQQILKQNKIIHAIHMGGNWGTNREDTNDLPKSYFTYLKDLNVDWVGISIALHYDDSIDSTVERKTSGVNIPTFSDEFLRSLIHAYHREDICVYLTLAFEAQEAETADRPVRRWQLGGNQAIFDDQGILPEFWPWALNHPDHERFVEEFWQSYSAQAVHFGQLAEDEGVALYSLGTETEGLFRTRSVGQWPNDFGEELVEMVSAVRSVYKGPLTYDMHYSVLTESASRGVAGSYHLWDDLGLDVIGLSSYFPLVNYLPTQPLSVKVLEERWEYIFQNYIIPLHNANPERPIYFTEFGATDSIRSPHTANAEEFSPRISTDDDKNGYDDGEETQANIYRALYNVMGKHPGVVNGTFLWGMMMEDNDAWRESFGKVREFSVRDKLAEDIVRVEYGGVPRPPKPTAPPPTPTLSSEEEISFYIYTDGVESGWNTGIFQGSTYPDSERLAHSGKRSIEADLQPWGSAGFWTNDAVDVSPYLFLEFFIHGGPQGGQQINVLAFNRETVLSNFPISIYTKVDRLPPGEWVLVQIPVKVLNPTPNLMTGFVIENHSNEDVSTIYIDDVRLVSAKP